jgi:hypothetical protein
VPSNGVTFASDPKLGWGTWNDKSMVSEGDTLARWSLIPPAWCLDSAILVKTYHQPVCPENQTVLVNRDMSVAKSGSGSWVSRTLQKGRAEMEKKQA